MQDRYHVTYEDIRALYTPILRHRILLNFHAESDRLQQDDILKQTAGLETGAEGIGRMRATALKSDRRTPRVSASLR